MPLITKSVDFLTKQPINVQNKISKIIEAIETLERIPTTYSKLLSGTNGLYEARIQLGTDIWRVYCFFDPFKWISEKDTENAEKRN